MQIIPDSEDDSENDIEILTNSQDAVGARPVQEISQSGTSSTESLQRNIQKAHRSLFQSQFDAVVSQSADVQVDRPSKKRRISERGTSYAPPSPDLIDSSDGANHFKEHYYGQDGNSLLDDVRGLTYPIIDPAALNPDPSSTIPNATFTQQQQERIITETRRTEDFEPERICSLLPTNESVVWSEFMTFSSAPNGEHSDSIQATQQSGYVLFENPPSETSTKPFLTTQEELEISSYSPTTNTHHDSSGLQSPFSKSPLRSQDLSADELAGPSTIIVRSPKRHRLSPDVEHESTIVFSHEQSRQQVQVIIPPRPVETKTSVDQSCRHALNEIKNMEIVAQDSSAAQTNAVSGPPDPSEDTKKNKKGRGRPRKNSNTTKPTAATVEIPVETVQEVSIKEIVLPCQHVIVQNTNEELQLPQSDAEQAPRDDCRTDCRTITSFQSRESIAGRTPQTPERSIKPSSRSPTNKSKVPHRVGLSKRARIAPLLRVLKK